ncbi:MAG: hypothetical protein HFI29_06060 [Lachnospiraceae bacterium]|jgi:hypothetical protein|nr:hypothetical protein [Lachnospiraceae bacterium]
MSRQERIFQTCLYMGALLLVLAADWHWFAGRCPQGNYLLRTELYPVIYGGFLAAIGGCLGAAVYFGRKARPKLTGRRHKRK